MARAILGTKGTSSVPEFAGSTWVRLQYMLGLERLGIETFWVDRIWHQQLPHQRRSLEYLAERFHRTAFDFGFADRYCIVCNAGERHFGLSEQELEAVAGATDLVINVGGARLEAGHPMLSIPRRVFLDVDPGFTQMWGTSEDLGFDQHNFLLSVGQNIDQPCFTIPTDGRDWRPTLPPVVLEHWPERTDERCTSYSTVADWATAQRTEFQGQRYSDKRSEFLRFIDLPQASGVGIELALFTVANQFEDIGLLCRHGWEVLNPSWVAGDPKSYREFIQTSRGELSVAKQGYVVTRSGWISDRTACYLASGKPALVQSTGIEERLPCGEGLLTFRDLDEAVAGLGRIESDYLHHCRAARRLAEEHFDSDKVLGRLLDIVGMS